MSYRINKGEAVSEAIRRVAREMVEEAFRQLAGPGRPVTRIHNSRKALKRIRALLGLVSNQLPSRTYQTESHRFRDLGRLLAPIRDVQVSLATLAKLKARDKNMAARELHEVLLSREKSLVEESAQSLSKARELLLRAKAGVDHWPAGRIQAAGLQDGLKEMYKRARKRFACACKNPNDKNLHKWRQQSKALWHGLELVEPLSRKSIRKRTKETGILADCLGLDHDWVLLGEQLNRLSSAGKRERQRLLKAIAKKRSKLQKRAFRIGKKVFECKPSNFAKRVACCLIERDAND